MRSEKNDRAQDTAVCDSDEINIGFTAPQLIANSIGALFCTFYFVFIDTPDIAPFFDSQLIAAILMTGGLLVIGTVFGVRWFYDVNTVEVQLRNGIAPDSILLEKVQRKLLNGPLTFSLLSFCNWCGAAVIMSGYRIIVSPGGEAPYLAWSEAGRLFFGILISGLITAFFVFFINDKKFRAHRPFFFPDGDLAAMKGVFRIKVRDRLFFSLMIISVLPALTVGGVLYQKISALKASYPELDLSSIVYAALFIVVVMTLTAVLLSRMIESNIAGPIDSLEDAIARVRQGDLTAGVSVTDNDELGSLADSFNHMIKGLRESEKMRHSLEMAREIQQSLLPKGPPIADGLDIAGYSVYCDETGGDYYDYIEMGEGVSEAPGVAVGDVSDHGIPSALLMTTARAFLRQRSFKGGGPAEIITDVNKRLVHDVEDSGRFMTMFFLKLDAAENKIRWVNAGHDPALLYDPESDVVTELTGGDPALGLADDIVYHEFERETAPGHVIVIGTDGIWETRSPEGKMFGKAALADVIRANADKSAGEIVDSVFNDIAVFSSGREQDDDITLVVIKINP